MELIIKGGSFYRGTEPIRPEFGNAEQIACLKKFEKLGDILKDGLMVTPWYDDPDPVDAGIDFKCMCGTELTLKTEAEGDDDIDCFIGKVITCETCQRTYKADFNDDDELIMKLKTK
jgi:hypothetical protein